PVAGRHTNVAGCLPSVQALEVPLQVSARSQGPLEARHHVPAFPAACTQTPVWHLSVVQTLPSSVQLLLLGTLASAGQASVVPSHFSSRSHSLVPARHTKVLSCLASVQVVDEPLQ